MKCPVDLRFFDESEFGDSLHVMSLRLLVLLDAFRFRSGQPFKISPHERALARYDGDASESAHNVDCWGECLAVDGFSHGMKTQANARHRIELARALGFTGIGLYPHWQLDDSEFPGLHLDCRPNAEPGAPATWGGMPKKRGRGQRYISLEEALGRMPQR